MARSVSLAYEIVANTIKRIADYGTLGKPKGEAEEYALNVNNLEWWDISSTGDETQVSTPAQSIHDDVEARILTEEGKRFVVQFTVNENSLEFKSIYEEDVPLDIE